MSVTVLLRAGAILVLYKSNAGVSPSRFALLLSAPEVFWEPSFVHARWLLGQVKHRSLRLQHFDRPDTTQTCKN